MKYLWNSHKALLMIQNLILSTDYTSLCMVSNKLQEHGFNIYLSNWLNLGSKNE